MKRILLNGLLCIALICPASSSVALAAGDGNGISRPLNLSLPMDDKGNGSSGLFAEKPASGRPEVLPGIGEGDRPPANQRQYPPFGSGFETRQNTGSMMGGHTERASGYHGAGRGR
ncbi:MAG: hypothetical protein WCE66_00290 [Azonexus sp.]